MEPNAILAINSLDRYNKNQGVGGQLASFAASLENQYNKTGQPCNNFQVGGFGALIYGYIKKIQISQIQLEYNVPTVIPGKNDEFIIIARNQDPPNDVIAALITIPYGYYTPSELAAVVNIELGNSTLEAVTTVAVTYRTLYNDFVFASIENDTGLTYQISFPDIDFIKAALISLGNVDPDAYITVLRTYKLFGISIDNSPFAIQQPTKQTSQFLYTPYVDIFSTALTKYQKVKDNTTNASSDSTLIARIYLSGVAGPQNTGGEIQAGVTPLDDIIANTNYAYPLGSRPFVVTQDCNTPKVIRWSKDETVYALDFQLRDQYGDLLFTQFGTSGNSQNPIFYTEFQMTLMCIEGEKA